MSAPSQQLADLSRRFADGGVDRREFMRQAAALGVAGVASSALAPLGAGPAEAAGLAAQAGAAAAGTKIALDVAEWSYMWVNVKRAETARGRVRRRPADVRRVHDPHAGAPPVPGRPGARRRRAGHRLDGDARRTAGLVPVSRAGRLQGLRRRSPRARAVAAAPRPARCVSADAAGAREPGRPLHAAERQPESAAEPVPEEPHAVARSRQRRFGGPRPAVRGAGGKLRRRSSPLRARRPVARGREDPAAPGRAAVRDAARRPDRHRRPTPSPARTTCSISPGGRRARTCSTRSARRSS